MKKPNLFIVGEPKCGTSALYKFLEPHPEIFMSSEKEPNHFNTDLHEESDEYHGKQKCYPYRDNEKYLGLFAEAKEKIVGEGSTNYLYSKTAAKNIHESNPEAKIIIMIRDPVAFLHSLHFHFTYDMDENAEDFRTALSLEEERKKGETLPKTVPAPSLLYYSERAQFNKHIKRYLDIFDRKQIMIIVMEEFQNNNAVMYRKVLKFLGVDPDFTPEFKVYVNNNVVRFKKFKQLVLSSYYPVKIARTLIPEKGFNFARDVFLKLTGMYKPKPELDIGLKKKLMQQYKPEVERLSRLLNKNLILLWGYNKI